MIGKNITLMLYWLILLILVYYSKFILYKSKVNNNFISNYIKLFFSKKKIIENMAYSKNYNYAIKWNAKSGCTYLRQLFLKLHINELENKNVNHHNLEMLFQFPTNIDLNKILIIELVRNPYSRTVSMFCNKYCGGEGHNLLSSKIKLEKCTFRYFVKYLEKLYKSYKLDIFDKHVRSQISNLQSKVIKLENLNKIKNVYLDNLNLNIKNLEIEQINKTVNTKRTKFCGDKVFNINDTIFPQWQYFYDDEIKNIVYKIYNKDFVAYKYSKEII